MASTRVAVVGATGTLGRVLAEEVRGADGFELVAELSSSSSIELIDGVDLVVDATTPAVSPGIVERAVDGGARVLVATSGWSDDRVRALRPRVDAADGGVLIVPNFSLGSVLATAFAQLAAPYFDSIEIVEAHRAAKIDSPSGTAVRTAELVAAARRERGPVDAPHADQRARGQQVASVPVHSLRMTGVVAKQQVLLGGDGELVTIAHDTISSDAYRAGMRRALTRVRDLAGVEVGLERALGLPWLGGAPARPSGTVDDGGPSGQAAATTPSA